MQNRVFASVITIVLALAQTPILSAQASGQSAAGTTRTVKEQAFDPHDINGVWILAPRARGALPTLSKTRPPLTPWGQAKFALAKPTHATFDGTKLGPPVPEKEWNDPTLQCDPVGYPRIMFQPYGQLARFVMTPTEVIQFTEWDHTFRDIWTDGRKLPTDPEPLYYGFAVGHWDGGTFVVDSNGFADRTWLDYYGSPHSNDMTLHETFHRVSHDQMEWTITVNDPKTYTAPWVSDKIMLDYEKQSPRAESGQLLREDFCVWSDQTHFFSGIDSVGIGSAPTKGNKQP